MSSADMITQTRNKPSISFDFTELTPSAIHAQNIAVGGHHQQTAKFWGYYPLDRRQHRHHDAGGFFSSVECEHGFMPGVRRLQHDENRNKRVVKFRLSHSSARQLLPTTKTQIGAVTMTAVITMGAPARKPLARLPHLPVAPAGRKHSTPEHLHYKTTETGLIAYLGKKPVAWLYPGHHQGVINGAKRTVRFVDVAYHRQTDHGVNLETSFYDTMQEAVDFVASLFASKVGAA